MLCTACDFWDTGLKPTPIASPERVESRREREVIIGQVRYGGFARATSTHRGFDDRERMALIELLQKSEDGDFLRSVAEAVLQLLMEADVEGLLGAARHERSADRLNDRNGYRDRTFDTRLGPRSLRIPKLRQSLVRSVVLCQPSIVG